MKKLLTALVLISTMLTLTGCFQAQQAEQKQPEQKTEVIQEVKEETVTPPAETVTINDYIDPITADTNPKYQYDNTKGVLVDVTDDNKVLYTNPGHPDTVLNILGTEGDKIIIWETGMDNSPGPCYWDELWISDMEKSHIKHLDLNNLVPGLQPYAIPESKYNQEKIDLEACSNEIQNEASSEATSFVNAKYGFMLDLPATWGGYIKNDEANYDTGTITLSSKSAKERFVKLFLVKRGDHIPPMQLVGESMNYTVFVDSSMKDIPLSDEIKAENEKIYASFKEVIRGNYFSNSYWGNSLMFSPEEDKTTTFIFTNQDEAFKMLNLTADKPIENDCYDYSGFATVVITNKKANEVQTHTANYVAELASVVAFYPPACDI